MVVGLQEFAPLSLMTAIMGPGEERLKRWDLLVSTHLELAYPRENYVKLTSCIMMGLCVLLYGKKEHMKLFSPIKTAKARTGFQGVGENKGAVILR